MHLKIVSEYDQEIPQSQTADNPMAPRGRESWLLSKLVFLVSTDCCVALPHDDTGLSADCDCGHIFSAYVGSGPASTVHQTKYHEFQAPQNNI